MGGVSGCWWWWWGDSSLLLQWVAVVGGAGEKFFKIIFDPNELKSPQNNMFSLFLSIFGGRVGQGHPINPNFSKNFLNLSI